MTYNSGIAIAIYFGKGNKMSTNLNNQYITHHTIRRRMRWLLLLVIILCSSPFIASFVMKDDIGFKGFMSSSFNDPMRSFHDLIPAQRVNGQQGVMPQRIAVILWDEQDKNTGMGISCHGLNAEIQRNIEAGNCHDDLPKLTSERIFL